MIGNIAGAEIARGLDGNGGGKLGRAPGKDGEETGADGSGNGSGGKRGLLDILRAIGTKPSELIARTIRGGVEQAQALITAATAQPTATVAQTKGEAIGDAIVVTATRLKPPSIAESLSREAQSFIDLLTLGGGNSPAEADTLDTYVGADGKLVRYGDGLWKDYLSDNPLGDLNATLDSVVKDIITRKNFSREQAEQAFIDDIRSEFLDADGNLSSGNALEQYFLGSRLANLDAELNPVAVRIGRGLDPGGAAGAAFGATLTVNSLKDAGLALADAGLSATSPTLSALTGASARMRQRAADFGEGMASAALFVVTSDSLIDQQNNLNASEAFRAEAGKRLSEQLEPGVAALEIATRLFTDAANGNGFAQGLIAEKGAEFIAGALLTAGASPTLRFANYLLDARKVAKAAESASGVGTTFGKLGTVVENPGIRISSFTKHGIDQVVSRGVSPAALQATMNAPVAVLKQSSGRFLYVSQEAAVVVTPAGKVVTTYPSTLFDAPILNILKAAGK
ncbi:MAG: hypothetical protein HC850_09415 [Rhodomicrobium sp.]|nr:hypothetical protein [Rhodomicrobium sp.]